MIMPEGRGKASIVLRLIAKAIDGIIVTVLYRLVPEVGFSAALIYVLISDGLFDGQSLGKKVLRLRVISADREVPGSFKDSILRNSVFAAALVACMIPLLGWVVATCILAVEFLLALGNREGMRLGDMFARTRVLEN